MIGAIGEQEGPFDVESVRVLIGTGRDEMEMAELMAMTREQRMAEKGNEPPCPFCRMPRVRRSSYVRCNPCGVNWSDGLDLSRNPHMKAIASSPTVPSDGAPTVE